MATASALPVYRSAAHRKAVMQQYRRDTHAGRHQLRRAPGAAGWPYADLGQHARCDGLQRDDDQRGFRGACPCRDLGDIARRYLACGAAAAITGVWVALLSPFAADNPRYYMSAAAIIGMINAYLFVSVPASTPPSSAASCSSPSSARCPPLSSPGSCEDSVLKRDEARRDHLARERAERLARERARA